MGMVKFKFTLQKTRDYKKQFLEKEKTVLAKLRAEYNQIEEKCKCLEIEKIRLVNHINEECKIGTTLKKIKATEYCRECIIHEIEEVKTHLQVLESNIERQRKHVVNLLQDVATLDKLEEKQLEEYRKQELKESELLIEELISFKLATNNA
jgi:flagellar export protein FliJ